MLYTFLYSISGIRTILEGKSRCKDDLSSYLPTTSSFLSPQTTTSLTTPSWKRRSWLLSPQNSRNSAAFGSPATNRNANLVRNKQGTVSKIKNKLFLILLEMLTYLSKNKETTKAKAEEIQLMFTDTFLSIYVTQ